MTTKTIQITLESYDNLKAVAKVIKPKRVDNPSATEMIESVVEIIENDPLIKLRRLFFEFKGHYRETFGPVGLDYLEEYLGLFFNTYNLSDISHQLFNNDMEKLLENLKRNIPENKKIDTEPSLKDSHCLGCQDQKPNPTSQFLRCSTCMDVLCPSCSVSHINADVRHQMKKYQIPG